MKKIIIMVLAVVVIATLAMTGVSAEGRYVWNHSGEYANDPFNDSTRVGHDSPLEATIRFKTDVSFSKILFPMVWCAPHSNVTVEVLKGEEVVASAEFEAFNESANSGDVANVELDFGKKLAAGEYTLRLSVPEGFYAFFAYGEGQLSEDYIEYERGHAMFGLYTEDAGEGFVTFATEVGGGSSTPATGSSLTVDLSGATGNIDVKVEDGKVICTTTGGDPWVSIPLDNVDTSVYKFVTVTYTASAEIGSNNTYLQDTEKNPGYSGTQGTWTGHGMAGTGDGEQHSKTYEIAKDFPTMDGTILTGIRFTCCGDMDAVFTVESVVFSATDPAEQSQGGDNPGTADAAVIAIAAVACIALAGVVIAKKVR